VFAANRWPFGDVPCRLMHYLINVTAYVTVYTLVVISLALAMQQIDCTEEESVRKSCFVSIGDVA